MSSLAYTPWIAGALAAGLAAAGPAASPALACSGYPCSPNQFVPHGGSLPANAPAIAWRPGTNYDAEDGGYQWQTEAADLKFRCKASDGTTHDVPFTTVEQSAWSELKPTAALVEDETCTIVPSVDDCAGSDGYWLTQPLPDPAYLDGRATFRVAAPAELPKTLGTLTAGKAALETLELEEDAGCTILSEACVVHVSVEFSEQAEPWRDAFLYTTQVDGKAWHVHRSTPMPWPLGGSYAGRGKDVILYVPSSGAAATFRGTHVVVMRAQVPGTDEILTTAPLTIDVDCGEPVVDGGVSADAAMEIGDASAATDGAAQTTNRARSIGRDAASADDGGCSVARVGAQAERGWSLAALLLGAGVLRRVRRSARRRLSASA